VLLNNKENIDNIIKKLQEKEDVLKVKMEEFEREKMRRKEQRDK
jgi:hypothetical protein